MSDVPTPTPDSLPYWEGLRTGRLILQRCGVCGLVRHYPRPVCPSCFSMHLEWVEAAGTGTVHSWTETHHPFLPDLRDHLPYVLVTADLPEGPRLLARLRGNAATLAIGAPLRLAVEPIGEWSIPVWELALPL